LSPAVLRYPREALLADYIRAGTGALLCGLPLVLLQVNRWVGVVLGASFLLFAVFFVRTAFRHMTRYRLGPDTFAADGPVGGLVEWARLERMALAYYSTKRDRSGGWMQLAVRSAGARTVKIDSSLDGFYDIVARAAQAAEARDLELSQATRANLRSMGLSVAGQEEAA
jgi:hypothetical protein